MLPRTLALHQNYPNPFNPSTTIRYDIPVSSGSGDAVPVELRLYDLRGRLIRTLVMREQEAGTYSVHWDGRNDRQQVVGSGMYLYRLKVAGKVLTRKMTLIR